MSTEIKQADYFECKSVYWLESVAYCCECSKPTRMFALMALPPFSVYGGHEYTVMDEKGSMLSEIATLPTNLAHFIPQHAKNNFRVDESDIALMAQWMNHCDHCDSKLEDEYVQGPEGPFFPQTEEMMDFIGATKIVGPFIFYDAQTSYCSAMAEWRDAKHHMELIQRTLSDLKRYRGYHWRRGLRDATKSSAN